MLTRRQTVAVVVGVGASSVLAMVLVAGAAWAGMRGDGLTAMSTVISTALAAIAVVTSLGVAEIRPGPVDGADAGPAPGSAAFAPGASKANAGSIEIDLATGRMVIRLADTELAADFEPGDTRGRR